jgi:ribonuclease VapC
MVIDASALIAILAGEPDAEIYNRALVRDAARVICPVNWLEVAMVLNSRDAEARAELDAYVARAAIEIVPVDAEQMRLAEHAWKSFGKGRHRARLNLGDCFAYALAKSSGEPLLFKGDDFRHTDVTPVL